MSLVHALPPLKVTLALPTKGFLPLADSGVHEQAHTEMKSTSG
jgi:hypothetical protein